VEEAAAVLRKTRCGPATPTSYPLHSRPEQLPMSQPAPPVQVLRDARQKDSDNVAVSCRPSTNSSPTTS
jgi:hypothetical protein